MTPEEQEAADKASAEKANAPKSVSKQNKKVMTPEEQEAADKASAEKANAPKSKKKSVEDLKSTDTVVVSFKNPVHVEEDGENTTRKESIDQHVKYEFWLSLAKDKNGNPKYSTLRGAKLIGYVENDKVIKF